VSIQILHETGTQRGWSASEGPSGASGPPENRLLTESVKELINPSKQTYV